LKTALLLVVLLTGTPGRAQNLQDLPSKLPSRYGVLGLRPLTIDSDRIAVDKVLLYSPAHRAGLQKGDLIVAIPPYRIRNTDELNRCVQSYAPGDTLILIIEREGQRLQLESTVSDIRHLYYLMDENLANKPSVLIHSVPTGKSGAGEQAAHHLIEREHAIGQLDSLQKALVFDAGRYGSACRLQTVNLALNNPLGTGRIARTLTTKFATGTTLADHLMNAARYLDLEVSHRPQTPLGKDDPVLSFLLGPLSASKHLTDRAFAALSDAERSELANSIPDLIARFGDTFLLDEGDSTETTAHIHTLRLAKKIELSALFSSALHLVQLTELDSLKSLRRKLKHLPPTPIDKLPPDSSGDFLYAEYTPLGWVLIGDDGPNFYGTDAAAIVDIGGNDIYFHSHPNPTALIIDYNGDDRYLGGGYATGIGSVSLLVDLDGNDLYQGSTLAQGAAFCGIGILWDHKGDDLYLNGRVGQGAAFFGAGMLVDEKGNDLYSAELFAQGFGGMRGLGALIDLSGNDRYLVDGKVPSSYGTADTYAGWGQGVGCGFRGFGSGGIGLLLDHRGTDYYQGGDFAQGIGYFFGLGVLSDLRGNDQYRGSRYAQGAAAHQAAGILLEDSGNDLYQAEIAASQGAGWDAAIGYLADLAGNDRYQALHLSQGAGAMNGLGLLYDGDGRDHYETRTGQGQGSSTTYWGGRHAPNLGLLIDHGNDEDTYSLRKNHSSDRDPGIGLFYDQ